LSSYSKIDEEATDSCCSGKSMYESGQCNLGYHSTFHITTLGSPGFNLKTFVVAVHFKQSRFELFSFVPRHDEKGKKRKKENSRQKYALGIPRFSLTSLAETI